eukprot:TRINITY_DN137_c0_g1_i2.p1 TRINITY_DN137_c0_g1~~TRINITY_DN137_c0_g1_i2.p1  ORF type:complete len:420 (-),score=46.86 TRINITY_DN137_c0_g1_i2:39-1247(-)
MVFSIAVVLTSFAVAIAELPPYISSKWTARTTCGYPINITWYNDLTSETGPRSREVFSMPSIMYGSEHVYVFNSEKLDAAHPDHKQVVYDEGGDVVCALDADPPVNIPNLFPMMRAIPNLQWKHQGREVVAGHNCDTWFSPVLHFSVSIGGDGTPWKMMFIADAQNTTCTLDTTLGVDEEVFVPSDACQHYPTPPCPVLAGDAEVKEITVYRLTSAGEPLDLYNRDTADIIGAPSTLCDWPDYTTQSHFTAWSVTVNTSYGQYGRCHFNGTNYCDAGTGNQVGRQAVQGLGPADKIGPLQGQCSDNKEMGSWLSFPLGGRCAPGAKVGDSGCTWIPHRFRTIDPSCLKSKSDVQKWCSSAPLYKSISALAPIIEAAFASADSSKGGCPDVAVVDASNVELLV